MLKHIGRLLVLLMVFFSPHLGPPSAHAKGGLVVAETGTNATGRGEGVTGFADPKVIENGDDRVKLFYLAGEDRVWYPASMKIDGRRVIVASSGVKKPRGVSYGTGGIGFAPNLYNKALLPTTPFIYFDNEMVTSKTWPDEKLKVAGETIDPATVGKLYEYRKMPLLSVQYSRIVLPLPISSRVSSPAYFLSCGSSPTEANW